MLILNQLTERQKSVLFSIIDEYTKSVKPISSGLIFKKKYFNLSPASLRNEMHLLTRKGFLSQPHTSAGRIPTDKSLRLFVNNIFNDLNEKFHKKNQKDFAKCYVTLFRDGFDDEDVFYNISKTLSKLSKHFVISGILEKERFFKFGLKDFFIQSELKISQNLSYVGEIIDNFDSEIKKIIKYCNNLINIFIGKEIPFDRKISDFSLIVAKKNYKKNKNAVIAMLGPKHMDYKKNLYLIGMVNDFLDHKF